MTIKCQSNQLTHQKVACVPLNLTFILCASKQSLFEFYLQEISTYVTNSSLELSYVFYVMEYKYF